MELLYEIHAQSICEDMAEHIQTACWDFAEKNQHWSLMTRMLRTVVYLNEDILVKASKIKKASVYAAYASRYEHSVETVNNILLQDKRSTVLAPLLWLDGLDSAAYVKAAKTCGTTAAVAVLSNPHAPQSAVEDMVGKILAASKPDSQALYHLTRFPEYYDMIVSSENPRACAFVLATVKLTDAQMKKAKDNLVAHKNQVKKEAKGASSYNYYGFFENSNWLWPLAVLKTKGWLTDNEVENLVAEQTSPISTQHYTFVGPTGFVNSLSVVIPPTFETDVENCVKVPSGDFKQMRAFVRSIKGLTTPRLTPNMRHELPESGLAARDKYLSPPQMSTALQIWYDPSAPFDVLQQIAISYKGTLPSLNEPVRSGISGYYKESSWSWHCPDPASVITLCSHPEVALRSGLKCYTPNQRVNLDWLSSPFVTPAALSELPVEVLSGLYNHKQPVPAKVSEKLLEYLLNTDPDTLAVRMTLVQGGYKGTLKQIMDTSEVLAGS